MIFISFSLSLSLSLSISLYLSLSISLSLSFSLNEETRFVTLWQNCRPIFFTVSISFIFSLTSFNREVRWIIVIKSRTKNGNNTWWHWWTTTEITSRRESGAHNLKKPKRLALFITQRFLFLIEQEHDKWKCNHCALNGFSWTNWILLKM